MTWAGLSKKKAKDSVGGLNIVSMPKHIIHGRFLNVKEIKKHYSGDASFSYKGDRQSFIQRLEKKIILFMVRGIG